MGEELIMCYASFIIRSHHHSKWLRSNSMDLTAIAPRFTMTGWRSPGGQGGRPEIGVTDSDDEAFLPCAISAFCVNIELVPRERVVTQIGLICMRLAAVSGLAAVRGVLILSS
jgi:hypothetical protein